jgi:hypothetical protein
MKKLLVCWCLLPILSDMPFEQVKDDRAPRLKHDLLGTWDCVLPPEAPRSARQTILVTPGHHVWALYDVDSRRILAISGGVWNYLGDNYRESYEYASDTHQHLRGKTFQFVVTVTGQKWDKKAVPGTKFKVDEVWNRVKAADGQKANVEPPAKDLLGAWEGVADPGDPALRILKYVTATHWTWAIFDRENKMVMTAMGGPWFVKDGKYVETVDFATDNFAQSRGNSNAYGFEVRDDRWFLKRGPELAGAREEVWKRIK